MPYENDDQYSLVRTIRYTKKDNDNPFLIKYYGTMPPKNSVEDKKINSNSQATNEKNVDQAPTPKVDKIAKEGHYERKN